VLFTQETPLEIFIAEDCAADIRWLAIVLSEMGLTCRFTVTMDDGQAAQLLARQGQYANIARPDLVLIDLNLSGLLSSVDVIEHALRTNADLPFCIVTGTDGLRDTIIDRFSMDSRRFLVKPVTAEVLLEAFESFEHLSPIATTLRSH
jgi:two-component system, chemotaxis family, response regulator Rcp1